MRINRWLALCLLTAGCDIETNGLAKPTPHEEAPPATAERSPPRPSPQPAPEDATAQADATGPSSEAGDAGAPPASCEALAPWTEPPEQVYVAPGGSDGAAGTQAAPLASLGAAAKRLPQGGTIVVRGGTYGPQTVSATGTAGRPLVIRAEAGETPVFDGRTVKEKLSSVIDLKVANHVVIRGLEVAHCSAPSCEGIGAADAVNDLTVRECHLHDLRGGALNYRGKKIRLLGNHVHEAVLENTDIAMPRGGWASCLGTAPDRDQPRDPFADDVVIRDNLVEDCWGEGIDAFFASNVTIEGNRVLNAFNVGIYMDNAFRVSVARNFVQISRGLGGSKGAAVLMATEPYPSWGLTPSSSHDVTIVNNVLVGGTGVGWWRSGDTSSANTYANVSVLHNTVIASAGALSFGTPAGPAPTGCVAKNNLLDASSAGELGSPGAWTFSGNGWLNGRKPTFAGASDVELAAAVGAIGSAAAAEPLAKIAGAGDGSVKVTGDFGCHARAGGAPVRGAWER